MLGFFFTRPLDSKVFPMDGQVYDFPQAFSTNAYNEKDKIIEKFFSYQYYFNYYNDVKTGIDRIHYSNFDRIANSLSRVQNGRLGSRQ